MSRKNFPYVYTWGNPKKPLNEKRLTLKGRKCRVLVTGRMNSVKVEFENGQHEIVSRRALRRIIESMQLCLFTTNAKAARGGNRERLKNQSNS